MRTSVVTLVALVLVAANQGLAAMPEVVAKFEDTKALWEKLQNEELLSGHHARQLGEQSAASWYDFLRTKGAEIVHEAYHSLRIKGRGGNSQYRKLQDFVANPDVYDDVKVNREPTKVVGESLIEKYALHKESLQHSHMPAVREYMSRPDNAENLLWD